MSKATATKRGLPVPTANLLRVSLSTHNVMRYSIIFAASLAITCHSYADQTNSAQIAACPNIASYHIDSLEHNRREGTLVRKISASLVRAMKGRAPDKLTFEMTMQVPDAPKDLATYEAPIFAPNEGWFHAAVGPGCTVTVGYQDDPKRFSFLDIGEQYVTDFALIASLPEIPQIALVQPKIDEFLLKKEGRIHTCVATYLASCICFSEWDENLWKAYVKDNPLRLRGEALQEMHRVLAGSLYGTTAQESIEAKVRVARINQLTRELVAQISASADDADSRARLGSILQRLIHQVSYHMTPSTVGEVDRLLESEKLTMGEKKAFQNIKTQMRTKDY